MVAQFVLANAAKIIILYYKPAEPMWPRARRRPQQRNIDFLQKIIVCPCILSTCHVHPCSLPSYFGRAFYPFFNF